MYRIYNGTIDYTRTLSPSLVNDARVGVNYTFNNTGTIRRLFPTWHSNSEFRRSGSHSSVAEFQRGL